MKKTIPLVLSLVMVLTTLCALPFAAQAKVISGGAGPSAEFIFDSATGEMLFRGQPTGTEGVYENGTIDGDYGDKTDCFDDEAYDEAITIGITSMVFDRSISSIEIIWPFQGISSVKYIELNGQDVPAGCFEGCTALEEIDISTTDYLGECAFARCPNLKYVSVGKNAEDIGAHALGFDYSREVVPYEYKAYDGFKIVSPCVAPAVEDYISRYPEIKWQKVHDYPSNGTVTKKASMSVQGFEEYYCGECQQTKTVAIPKIKSVTLSNAKYTYNGKAKKPSVTVKDAKGKKLKKGTDYSVSYGHDNVKVGTFKVVVKFKGKYTGQKTLNATIFPHSTKITNLKGKKKSLQVYWEQISSACCTGYQIQLCQNQNFTGKTKKTYTLNTSKQHTGIFKNLKKGKKYWVRIRTIYKHKDGKTYASDWCRAWGVKVQ